MWIGQKGSGIQSRTLKKMSNHLQNYNRYRWPCSISHYWGCRNDLCPFAASLIWGLSAHFDLDLLTSRAKPFVFAKGDWQWKNWVGPKCFTKLYTFILSISGRVGSAVGDGEGMPSNIHNEWLVCVQKINEHFHVTSDGRVCRKNYLFLLYWHEVKCLYL